MNATLIPSASTLSAMHPYMGLPRDVRQAGERAILNATRAIDSVHGNDAQVASLALRSFEAGYRLALRGLSPLPPAHAEGGAK